MANLTFTLASGRTVGVTSLGDPDAERLIVFCHSAPGSSIFDPDPLVTSTRNVHVVALDRPGYGASDPLPAGHWPSIPRYADDVAEYLRVAPARRGGASESTGPGPVGIAGWSAGGRVALAFAARHPELVDRVAIVATPAPNEQVAWIPPELAGDVRGAGQAQPRRRDRAAQRACSTASSARCCRRRPDQPVPLDAVGATEVDAAVLELPGARDRLERMMRDAFAQGTRGLAADILSYTARPWGFDVAAVKAKTLIVNGQADALAGNAHATWYQQNHSATRASRWCRIGGTW